MREYAMTRTGAYEGAKFKDDVHSGIIITFLNKILSEKKKYVLLHSENG